MLKRILLVFMMFGMLIACVGLQSTTNTGYNMTHAPHDTARAEATLGTENSFSLTEDSRVITQTAYIASIPTLSTEQGQIIRQTQDALLQQAYARATIEFLTQTASVPLITAHAEAFAQGTNPFILTVTANAATIEANPSDNSFDEFSLTATSIIQTATARAGTPFVYNSPTPCPYEYAWTEIVILYPGRSDNPEIREFTEHHCSVDVSMLFSHAILIDEYPVIDFDLLPIILILEDVVSRLPDYPPYQPEVSETIRLAVIGQLYADCGIFTYSDAIAAYESGLRGEDLAQALGLRC